MKGYMIGLKGSRTSAKYMYSNHNYFYVDNIANKIMEGNQINLQWNVRKLVLR